MSKNNYWPSEFNYDGDFEENKAKEDILNKSHEALTRFYQKESKRSKAHKQKRQCWQ